MVHNTSVPQRFLVEICVLVNKLIDGPYAIFGITIWSGNSHPTPVVGDMS
ncbi:conserved domain protein [Trichinella spiralis]|nr:conserved domain protein [Trichinella spiralis]